MLSASKFHQNVSTLLYPLPYGPTDKEFLPYSSRARASFRTSRSFSNELSFRAFLVNLDQEACSHKKSVKTCRKCKNTGGQTLLKCTKAKPGLEFELGESHQQDGTPAGSRLVPLLRSERVKVAVMVALAMALCNVDRVVMSVAILPLSSNYNWTPSFAGIVQSSFLWGYLLSPIAGGALTDRYGGKIVMSWGVGFWSAATLLTPFAASKSWLLLLAVRALMGLAEGVAMPCMNNLISRWFPRSERARAVGVSMAGFHLGSALGLVLTPLLLTTLGISGAFVAFGCLGFLWLLLWVAAIHKNPQSHPFIKKEELLYIEKESEGEGVTVNVASKVSSFKMPPFELLLSKPPTWAIIVAHAMNNWGYFILLSWMPSYFKTVLKVNLKQAAWFSALPWAMMATIGLVAGAASDFLAHSGMDVTTIRKVMQSVAFIGPAIALLGLNAAHSPMVASAWLTAALGLTAFGQAGFLVNHQDIGPQYAGVLIGMSNTAGTLAAILSTVGTGFLVEWLGSFQAVLMTTSLLYVLSTLVWNVFATGERVFRS